MGGRPTKYSEEMLQKASDYLALYDEKGDEVPTAAGLSLELGVNKSTVYEWAGKHDEFSNTLNAINACQERILISKGLNSKFNSTITKLMLANHGYSDKQQIEHGNNADSPIDFSVTFVSPNHEG